MKNKFLNIIGIITVAIAVMFACFFTKEKVMSIGIKFENMDLSTKPGKDFYDFATKGWRDNNPIPDDYTRWTSFHILAETNLERIREVAENDTGKIGLLYKIAMDADKLNEQKTAPVKQYLDEIDNIKSVNDLPKYLGHMHRFSSAFWEDIVALDEMDSSHYIFDICQGGTGLSRDYYFDDDEKSIDIRKKYKQYIKTQMDNFGVPVNADKLYAFEERMAKSFYKKEKLRDPLANYHKKSFNELKNEIPNFNWDGYFDARGIKPDFINVAQIEPIKESVAIMNDTDIDLIKTYLKFRIIIYFFYRFIIIYNYIFFIIVNINFNNIFFIINFNLSKII